MYTREDKEVCRCGKKKGRWSKQCRECFLKEGKGKLRKTHQKKIPIENKPIKTRKKKLRERIKIRLLRNILPFKAGQILETSIPNAHDLVKMGWAKYLEIDK